MRKLVRGIAAFREQKAPEQRELFLRLALGQAPDALFICCSDSRVVPSVMTSSDPGDLFIIRNIGNLVPACDAHGVCIADYSEAAAIEFAVASLDVRDVIVCGHSECGAMRALLEGPEAMKLPNLRSWVETAQPLLARWKAGEAIDPDLTDVNRLSQLNVLEQVRHLLSYPLVRKRVAEGTLALHAWWFDIAHAEVFAFDPARSRFAPVDSWVESANLGAALGIS